MEKTDWGETDALSGEEKGPGLGMNFAPPEGEEVDPAEASVPGLTSNDGKSEVRLPLTPQIYIIR